MSDYHYERERRELAFQSSEGVNLRVTRVKDTYGDVEVIITWLWEEDRGLGITRTQKGDDVEYTSEGVHLEEGDFFEFGRQWMEKWEEWRQYLGMQTIMKDLAKKIEEEDKLQLIKDESKNKGNELDNEKGTIAKIEGQSSEMNEEDTAQLFDKVYNIFTF